MGRLKSKVQFYRSMAMMYDAGLPLSKSLAQNHSSQMRGISTAMSVSIEKDGSTMSEQMQTNPRFFTNLECQLVRAGERTGGLDVIFKALADWFETRQKLNNRIISGMAYPILLFHFAAIIIPCITFLIGKTTVAGTLLNIAVFLCPPYLILFAYLLIDRFKYLFKTEIPVVFSRMALGIPVFGNLFRKMDHAQFFGVFSLAMDSGISIKESINLGAESCRNQYVRKAFLQTASKIEEEGCNFTEAFAACMPEEQSSMEFSMLETGEQSGKISDSAKHVANAYNEEAQLALNIIANIVPKIVYFIIVIYMALTIIRFWTQL